ncbi:MAG TPA: PPC domain-containing protein [Blastocatellia bacterium]|nr:PPC domain-containing protein [Blastocatellia bacterium]HMV85091.1 PPC domain-containing protein [Blastocatellia bacterium]HMX26199.1 PPC domain-containing protein [Blastocatellia bacterium]HMZ22323.1 PPC domain-containing protein [Blastocatellia bacterium]HNG28347.1 PPC domain-containing protein [Blastocatellia bacterium]
MKKQLWLFCGLLMAAAITARAQVAQPYLTATSPMGAQRGTTATFTVDGYNLTDAGEVIWSKPGIAAKIKLNSQLVREPHTRSSPTATLIVDKSTKHRLTIEAAISAEALPGIYGFRIRTPLGTTNLGRIVVGALPEVKEREANDSIAEAQTISLPSTIVGELQKRGDTDFFKFTARAGQQIVFEVVASMLNSRLDSVLTLFDDKGAQLATNNDNGASRDSLLGYTFKQDGSYVLRISDLERQGQVGAFGYRLNIGELPYLTHAFPLGVRENTATEVAAFGFNLDAPKATVLPQLRIGFADSKPLAMSSGAGQTINTLALAVGAHPEVMEQSKPTTLTTPQSVSWPVTINGRIFNPAAAPTGLNAEDVYRFQARKGQRIVLEVGAQRFGSPLDAVIEVLDAKGNPIPRIVARALLETQMTLNDRDSASRGFRINTWNGIHVNDYLMAGNELVQVEVLPKTPDEDISFKSFQGQRLTYEDTTPEAHPNGLTIYKVSLHSPDTKLASNGLPVTTFYFRNDDGGPIYGKDSKLNFTAPADGDYLVRIRDVRGMQGERFAYRLTIHEPEPDFILFADPENPNVPQGGSLPITVTAFRNDGFDGDITVKLMDVPAGFAAGEGVIRSGQTSTVVRLSAAADAQKSFPLRIQATATINGKTATRQLRTDERIAVVSVAPAPELLVWTDAEQVALEPGGKAVVSIKIKRERGFAGRVPFDIRNLPHGVIVTDVGLNGVLITEEETTQQFTLAAESWVKPMEQPIFVVGRIETTSPQRSDFPAKPITLVVKPQSAVKSEQREN